MKIQILLFSLFCCFLNPVFAETTSGDAEESVSRVEQGASASKIDSSAKTAQYVSSICRTMFPLVPRCLVDKLAVNSPCFCPYTIDEAGKNVRVYNSGSLELLSKEKIKELRLHYVQGIVTFN